MDSVQLPPFSISGPGFSVLMVVEVYEEHGSVVFSIRHLEGVIDLRPKAWLAVVRDCLDRLEQQAIEAGCHEMRLQGRDWSPVLKGMGWERLDGLLNGKNGMRKLLPRQGIRSISAMPQLVYGVSSSCHGPMT